SKDELEQLASLTEVGEPVDRQLASASREANESICRNPKGDINECAWMCQNNPKGQTRCRTDLPQVNCVRKRCDGNGDWSDENRLPANFFDRCKPDGFKVAPCDY
ncbi:MAG: hypothetical protein AAF202_08645, partial [Pseudomonadota bacterium]